MANKTVMKRREKQPGGATPSETAGTVPDVTRPLRELISEVEETIEMTGNLWQSLQDGDEYNKTLISGLVLLVQGRLQGALDRFDSYGAVAFGYR